MFEIVSRASPPSSEPWIVETKERMSLNKIHFYKVKVLLWIRNQKRKKLNTQGFTSIFILNKKELCTFHLPNNETKKTNSLFFHYFSFVLSLMSVTFWVTYCDNTQLRKCDNQSIYTKDHSIKSHILFCLCSNKIK